MFTSYRVIELVRAKISTPHVTASDTQVARAIGISRAAVSAYKVGRDIMTHDTLARAQTLLRLEPVDVGALACDLLLERSRTDEERAIFKSLLALVRRAGTKAASILLVGLALLTVGGKASAADVCVGLVGNSQIPNLYIMRNWARRRRGLAKLLRCLKTLVAAPLLPPCAGNHWRGSPLRSWPLSAACI